MNSPQTQRKLENFDFRPKGRKRGAVSLFLGTLNSMFGIMCLIWFVQKERDALPNSSLWTGYAISVCINSFFYFCFVSLLYMWSYRFPYPIFISDRNLTKGNGVHFIACDIPLLVSGGLLLRDFPPPHNRNPWLLVSVVISSACILWDVWWIGLRLVNPLNQLPPHSYLVQVDQPQGGGGGGGGGGQGGGQAGFSAPPGSGPFSTGPPTGSAPGITGLPVPMPAPPPEPSGSGVTDPALAGPKGAAAPPMRPAGLPSTIPPPVAASRVGTREGGGVDAHRPAQLTGVGGGGGGGQYLGTSHSSTPSSPTHRSAGTPISSGLLHPSSPIPQGQNLAPPQPPPVNTITHGSDWIGHIPDISTTSGKEDNSWEKFMGGDVGTSSEPPTPPG